MMTLFAALASAWTPAQPAVVELPAPTGRYPVATTSWRTHRSLAPGNVRGRRRVPPGRGRSPGIPPRRAAARSRRICAKACPRCARSRSCSASSRRSTGLKPCERTPSSTARRRPRADRFPVLVFSHGYTGVPSSYTALLEDLASHGYAVLSVVHPYEATAATLERRPRRFDERQRRHVPPGHPGRLRRVGLRRRDDGGGDARDGRGRTGPPVARLSRRPATHRRRAAPMGGRHEAGDRSALEPAERRPRPAGSRPGST